MNKYTVKESIKRDLSHCKSIHAELRKIEDLLKPYFDNPHSLYAARTAFWKYYTTTNYSSEKKLNAVPIGGYMFPVCLFDVSSI